MQTNPHLPTVCLWPVSRWTSAPYNIKHTVVVIHSYRNTTDWAERNICFCPKGNHSEHKRNLITGQRCPEFLSASPTELHVRSRSLCCQLSHATSAWSLIVFVCKRWGWRLELCLLLPARSSLRSTCTMSPDACSERHHKAYRHFSTVNDETERTWRRLIEEPNGNLKSCLTDDCIFNLSLQTSISSTFGKQFVENLQI